MGWNFRKSFKLFPGLRLNLSKKGLTSATIGKRGLSASVGKQGIFRNLGIPGTGLSHRSQFGNQNLSGALIGLGIGAAVLVGVVALCVIFAAVERNTRQQEQIAPVRQIANVPPAPPTPGPTRTPLRKKNKK